MKRENEILESYKSLQANKAERAAKFEAATNKDLENRKAFTNKYYKLTESREARSLEHGKLLSEARDNALKTALKAIYITALEADTLTDNALILAENMVDNYVTENGGAQKIFNNVKADTYLLAKLRRIVEDNAEATVDDIENPKFEDTDDESKDDSKEPVTNGSVDIDELQAALAKAGLELVHKDDNVDIERKEDEPTEDKSSDEEKTEESPEKEKESTEESDKEESTEEEKTEESPKEDEEPNKEEISPEDEMDADLDTSNDEVEVPKEDEESKEEEKAKETSDEDEDIVKVEDSIEDDSDTDKEIEDIESDKDEEDIEVEEDEDSEEDEDDDIDLTIDDEEESESEDDEEAIDIDGDGDNDIGDIEEPEATVNTDPDKKMFEELEDEEEIKTAVELIRSRVADAEEAFIKRNAEDKNQIDELLGRISNNIATVNKIANEDDPKSKIAQEAVVMCKRKINEIDEHKALTVYEKMTRNLTKSLLEDVNKRSNFINESGLLDTALVTEASKVMYGFLETLNTLQLESVNGPYIQNILNNMK